MARCVGGTTAGVAPLCRHKCRSLAASRLAYPNQAWGGGPRPFHCCRCLRQGVCSKVKIGCRGRLGGSLRCRGWTVHDGQQPL
jgi:hypothetical protein